MSRARVTRLALVNWKGLVYEELELDEGVTALEGENGAGKTTLMIGAYTVLLPDLNLLKFTNVGETGSTGGDAGIWGRLGPPGASYAWLDLELPRRRVVIGVHLHRLARPRLEISPFLLDDVPADVPLEQLVMRRRGTEIEVPDAKDIPSIALARGAKPKAFGGDKKGYFKALFDLGITPLRMATSEERKKLDDMLRTCMMGGISNVLRTGLRDFLFAENTRLADTIKRMERNLSACRKTRAEVELNERLQAEISKLYKAGEETFVAATRAVARWEEEQREAVSRLTERQRSLAGRKQESALRLAALEGELRALAEERQGLDERVRLADGRVASVRTALDLSKRLQGERSKLQAAERTLTEARESLSAAADVLGRASETEERARGRADEAAKHLSDHQQAYQDLSRKVGLHRAATQRLQEARDALGDPGLDRPTLDSRLAEARDEAERLKQKSIDLRLRVEDAEGHAARHAEGLAALRVLLGDDASVADLGRADELRGRLERASEDVPDLERRTADADRDAETQAAVRARGSALSVSSRAELSAAVEREETSQVELGAALGELDAKVASLGNESQRIGRELGEAEARVQPWTRLQRDVEQAASPWGSVDGADELRALYDRIDAEHRGAKEQLQALQTSNAALRDRIRALEDRADQPDHVLAARDAIDAELVAEHFDEVPVDEAARTEAVLGSSAFGLLVSNPTVAARALSAKQLLAPGQELVLLHGLPDIDTAASVTEEGHLLVPDGERLRLVHPTDRPLLGRAARQRAVEGLRATLAEAEGAEDRALAALQRLEHGRGALLGLLPRAALLDEPDPRPTVEALTQRREAVDAEHTSVSGQRDETGRRLQSCHDLLKKLRGVLPDAQLLDPPDRSRVAAELRARLEVARADRRRWRETQATWRALDGRRDDLRRPPLDGASLEALANELAGWETRRRSLSDAIAALAELVLDPEPLGWGHFEADLREKGSLVPRLEAELGRARGELKKAVEELETARADREREQSALSRAEAEQLAQAASVSRTNELLEETGVPEPTPEALSAAETHHARLVGDRATLGERETASNQSVGGVKHDLEGIDKELGEAEEELGKATREHENRQRTWERFRLAAAQAGLAPERVLGDDGGEGGSVNLFQSAKAGCRVVLALLPAEPELRAAYEAIGDGTTQEHVDAWAQLRRHLHRRIGPHVSESADVVQALDDLGRRLHRLQRRLSEHELELRTDAKAISTTISSQRRRAYSLVRSLSDALSKVRFGTIQNIQLRVEPLPRMDELLKALSGQLDLFSESRPIEEVLVELFQSIGGGRVQASRLLDYRQYFRVRVEAVRDDGSAVGARGDQMSTGEAIGIGAAVMMVVLQAWEEHSGKLRRGHSHGTLRFLFLDEATRLSRQSLLVLFDLCRQLELQLLLAAPDVPLVEGGTTYTLVRSDNRVVIHGRKVVARGVGG